MKTTIEIPDRLFREVKVSAASRGESLRQFFMEAVVERLRHVDAQSRKPWMKHYGALRDYSDEWTASSGSWRVNSRVSVSTIG